MYFHSHLHTHANSGAGNNGKDRFSDNCTLAPRLRPDSRDIAKAKEDNDKDVNSTAISITSSYCAETENSFGEALQASFIRNLEEHRENDKEDGDTIIVDLEDNQDQDHNNEDAREENIREECKIVTFGKHVLNQKYFA